MYGKAEWLTFVFQMFFRVGHEDKEGFAGWMLDKVEIQRSTSDKRLHFPFGRWVRKDEHGLIEQELVSIEEGLFFSDAF